MTHVVAEPCVGCKFTDCVEVCPVDAFREGENCLAIDPDACIDCTLCVPQCPVSAIYMDIDLPEAWSEWLTLNAKLSKVWPVITKTKEPMPDYRQWAATDAKRDALSERPGDGDG